MLYWMNNLQSHILALNSIQNFHYIWSIISRWSNFLCSTIGIRWGSHPSAFFCFFLCTAIGAIQSTLLASLETECIGPPLEIKSLLKIMSTPICPLYQILIDIKSSWRHVFITLPTLPSISSSLTPLNPIIYRYSLRFQLYDTSFFFCSHTQVGLVLLSHKIFLVILQSIYHASPPLVNSF